MDYVSTKYDPDKKIIALTFDDGPSTADTNGTSDLLDVLEQYDSRATFFCVGNNINDKSVRC
ncbi:MAG: polysaccharide deacetylase family protein [Coprococcus sp.]